MPTLQLVFVAGRGCKEGSLPHPDSGSNIPFHMGAPAFNQAAQAMHGIKRVAQKHAEVDSSFFRRVKLKAFKSRSGEDTLTLGSHSDAQTVALESCGKGEV